LQPPDNGLYQSAALKNRTSIILERHSYLQYQYVFSLVVSLPIRGAPGVLMNISLRVRIAFNN